MSTVEQTEALRGVINALEDYAKLVANRSRLVSDFDARVSNLLGSALYGRYLALNEERQESLLIQDGLIDGAKNAAKEHAMRLVKLGGEEMVKGHGFKAVFVKGRHKLDPAILPLLLALFPGLGRYVTVSKDHISVSEDKLFVEGEDPA